MYARPLLWSILIIALGATFWYWQKIAKKPSSNTPLVIFTFLGAPGSGKGTLAENCVKDLHFQMLSTGNLIREQIAKNTEFGRKLQGYTSTGQLVPDELIIDMVKEWISQHAANQHPIILDGFPRTAAQADALFAFLNTDYPNHIMRVIELRISDDAVVRRISNRVMCSNKECQAIYNVELMGGKLLERCTKCGSPLVQREDDREEVVRNRLSVYAKTRDQLVEFYKQHGLTINEIDVETKMPQDVFELFKEISAKA